MHLQRQAVRIQNRLPGENLPSEIIPAQTFWLESIKARNETLALTPVILGLFSCDAVVSAYVTRFMKLSRSEYVCECRPIHRGPAELKRNLMGSARMTISLRLACGLALASALPMLAMWPQPALAQATGTV